MMVGNKNSGRKSKPEDTRTLEQLREALAEQQAKEKAQKTGARLIRKRNERRK